MLTVLKILIFMGEGLWTYWYSSFPAVGDAIVIHAPPTDNPKNKHSYRPMQSTLALRYKSLIS